MARYDELEAKNLELRRIDTERKQDELSVVRRTNNQLAVRFSIHPRTRIITATYHITNSGCWKILMNEKKKHTWNYYRHTTRDHCRVDSSRADTVNGVFSDRLGQYNRTANPRFQCRQQPGRPCPVQGPRAARPGKVRRDRRRACPASDRCQTRMRLRTYHSPPLFPTRQRIEKSVSFLNISCFKLVF